MKTQRWTSNEIPNQKGKVIIITGANSGLGLEAAKVLCKKEATVILAVRNVEKGDEAIAEIKKEIPNAHVEVIPLDLSDLDSIRKFSEEFHAKYSQLNVLINNAGVMFPAKREATKQGFELQFGTNHLGHFLLTGLLLDIIKKTPGARIATQSSIYHKMKADIHFDDLNWEKSYNKELGYAQSKLANLLFTYELDRLLKSHQINAVSVAAHPGYTSTNLQRNMGFLGTIANALIAQSVEIGTLPILRAATEENLSGGEYFGPTKLNEMRGYPEKVASSVQSHDQVLAKKLWEVSEKLTGFHYNFD